MGKMNAVTLLHDFLEKHIPVNGICIDATCGNGKDTVFLADLVGKDGSVLAFDIQPAAIKATQKAVRESGCDSQVTVLLESHCHMRQYAQENSVDGIVFNFGYLPGGDHAIATQPDTSIVAIKEALNLLKLGGIMTLCIYQGGDTGYEEKDQVLNFLSGLDSRVYNVIVCNFLNHHHAPPIPVFITKKIIPPNQNHL